MAERFSFAILFIFMASVWLVPFSVPEIALPAASVGSIEREFNGGTLFFVGDIMLGRHVETIARGHGDHYPFARSLNIIQSADVSIGNFEGTVQEKHTQTKNHALQFSIRQDLVRELSSSGFDMLSLSNNHSLDFGEKNLLHTRLKCAEYGLVCAGHPYEIRESAIQRFFIGDTHVGVLFLHEPAFNAEDQIFLDTLHSLMSTTELQIIFVHWGNEYEKDHSPRQEEIAHFLIDSGVDAIIGHHSHVVQDVELYKGKPIMYSLGNFIFDQYFNDAVQEGLGVRIEIERDHIEYVLIPFTSADRHSQPRIMTIDEKRDFIENNLSNVGSRIVVSR